MKIDVSPSSVEYGWHKSLCDSAWSATLIKINKEGDEVMVGYSRPEYISDGKDNF